MPRRSELDSGTLHDDAATVTGLVIHEAQAIPDPGQRFAFGYRSKCCGDSATSSRRSR